MTLTCYAGPDAQTCMGDDYQCQGEATDWISIEWTSSGDGTFDDPTMLEAVYTPGSDDISNGSVVLTLAATDIDNETVDDEMTLILVDIPDQPAMPQGPDYVNLHNVTSSEYTVDAVTYASNYIWSVEPAEAGDFSGIGTVGTINWNASYMGTADISVKAVNNCGESIFSESLAVTVDNVVKISEKEDYAKLYVYPNPNNGSFRMAAHKSIGNASITVHNMIGDEIYHLQQSIADGEVLHIDLGQSPDGIYILSVTTEDQRITRKLVIQ
jgi:hypothetical protein